MTPRRVDQYLAQLQLLLRMLDPEDLGYSVTPEVRDQVRLVLHIPEAECVRDRAAAVEDE